MREVVQDYRKRNPLEQYDLQYPNPTPGIYINRRIVEEDIYIFDSFQNIIKAEELYYYGNWAGYEEIFLETELEYVYFREWLV